MLQVVLPAERSPADCRSNAAVMRDARNACRNTSECCTLCGVGCCAPLDDLCPPAQARMFDEQTNCFWRGGSVMNYETNYSGILSAADPPSFAKWLCAHWRMNVTSFLQTEWALWGIFAISRDCAHNWPASAYHRAATELLHAGRNGGVAVHFYERTARAIFSTSLLA